MDPTERRCAWQRLADRTPISSSERVSARWHTSQTLRPDLTLPLIQLRQTHLLQVSERKTQRESERDVPEGHTSHQAIRENEESTRKKTWAAEVGSFLRCLMKARR